MALPAAIQSQQELPLDRSPVMQLFKGPGFRSHRSARRCAWTNSYADGQPGNGARFSGYLTLYAWPLPEHGPTPRCRVVRATQAPLLAPLSNSFLPTWRARQEPPCLSGFGPASQDQAALDLGGAGGPWQRIDVRAFRSQPSTKLSREWGPFLNGATEQRLRAAGQNRPQLCAFHQRMLKPRRP